MYARLMTDMEDYQDRGINPKHVEEWENSRRSPCAKDCWEAWDVDATLDDGSLLSVRLETKDGASLHSANDAPVVRLVLVRGDGSKLCALRRFAAADCTWDAEALGVRCGECMLDGTLRRIHVEATGLQVQGNPGDGGDCAVEVSFDLAASTRPVRPATGILDTGRDGRRMLGWICPMPRAVLNGSLTVGGETRAIAGTARHAHAWGTVAPTRALNDWLFVTHDLGERTVALLDVTSSARSGFIRFPMVWVMNKRGNVIYSSTTDTACTARTIDWYDDPATGRRFPHALSYAFRTPDGGTVRYELRGQEPAGDPCGIPCGTGAFGIARHSYVQACFLAAGTLSVTMPSETGDGPEAQHGQDDAEAENRAGRGAGEAGDEWNREDSYDGADLHMRTTVWTGQTHFGCALAGDSFDVEHSPQILTEYAF